MNFRDLHVPVVQNNVLVVLEVITGIVCEHDDGYQSQAVRHHAKNALPENHLVLNAEKKKENKL